ncbi:hypothetical protein BSK48_03125 [Paenibacillus odorifer]|uniref:hypothetical protein n=2 Tax=Paenibacillus TaxID=44249 RepID=UPI00096CA701|nr:hypothetical protein [Paenibacillus odorifer]OMD73942.1 hypothetical protein BSK48_03125 [Paenibacillus odorifer]OMD87038.1 hypothetical protein BSK53_04945 [Paenibacillus odorifer]
MIAFLLGIYVAPSVETRLNGQTVASNPVIEEIPPSTVDKAAIAAESNTTGSNPTESSPSPSPEAVVLEDMPSDDDTGPVGDDSEDLSVADTPSGQGIGAPLEFKYSTNSADAVKLTWEADNLTGKRINYYTAHISTFNPVGDPSNDQLNGKSSFSLKYVGPVEPNDTLFIFSDFTYQNTIHTIIIDQLTLQYDDGTIETFDYGYETTDDSGL